MFSAELKSNKNTNNEDNQYKEVPLWILSTILVISMLVVFVFDFNRRAIKLEADEQSYFMLEVDKDDFETDEDIVNLLLQQYKIVYEDGEEVDDDLLYVDFEVKERTADILKHQVKGKEAVHSKIDATFSLRKFTDEVSIDVIVLNGEEIEKNTKKLRKVEEKRATTRKEREKKEKEAAEQAKKKKELEKKRKELEEQARKAQTNNSRNNYLKQEAQLFRGAAPVDGDRANAAVNAALAWVGSPSTCTDISNAAINAAQGTNYARTSPAGHFARATQVSDLQPGDILYYNDAGAGVPHTAVYIGNGQAVHGGFNGSQTVIASAHVGAGIAAILRP